MSQAKVRKVYSQCLMKGAKETFKLKMMYGFRWDARNLPVLSRKLFDQYEIRFLRLEQLKKSKIYWGHLFLIFQPLAGKIQNMKQSKHHPSRKSFFMKGVVHKLRQQDFGFFSPPTPLRWHFLWYKRWQKVASSCKRSLWTTLKPVSDNIMK